MKRCLSLKIYRVHRVIRFNQNIWLKPYIDMDTDLRKEKQKNDFKKDFGQNREKKELFSIRTKLSYYKVFHRTSISNRNEKNIYIYE